METQSLWMSHAVLDVQAWTLPMSLFVKWA